MTQMLVLGFLLGMRHALEPDHVAAVNTLVTRGRSLWKAGVAGAVWGAGHTLILALAGIITMVLGISVPDRLAMILEFLVGLVLVGLGISTFRAFRHNDLHLHEHRHGPVTHAHLHVHSPGLNHAQGPDRESPPEHEHPLRSGLRPLLIGMVHGLAGSAPLLVLVLGTVRSVPVGLLFILLFGVGSTLGMMMIGTVLALPLAFSAGRFPTFERWLRLAAGASSVAVGLIMTVQILLDVQRP